MLDNNDRFKSFSKLVNHLSYIIVLPLFGAAHAAPNKVKIIKGPQVRASPASLCCVLACLVLVQPRKSRPTKLKNC